MPGPDRMHEMHCDQRFGRGARRHFSGITDDDREHSHAVADALDLVVASTKDIGSKTGQYYEPFLNSAGAERMSVERHERRFRHILCMSAFSPIATGADFRVHVHLARLTTPLPHYGLTGTKKLLY